MISSKYKVLYLSTTKQQLNKLSSLLLYLEKKSGNQNLIENIFRLLHSMKGAAATMGYKKTVNFLHATESIVDAAFSGDLIINSKILNILFDALNTLKDNFKSIEKHDKELTFTKQIKVLKDVLKQKGSVKQKVGRHEQHILGSLPSVAEVNISTDKLDIMSNSLDDLLINSMRIKNLAEKSGDVEFLKLCVNSDKVLSTLRRELKNVRVVPLKDVLSSLPYLVREISRNSQKKVDLVIHDHDLSLDKAVVDELMEILIQLLKNAVAHGISANQKNGKIIIDFSLAGDKIQVIVSDNGQGIDWKDIVDNAVKRRIISRQKAQFLSSQEKNDLLFSAGVSKGEKINEVSGRGIGLSLVKNKVADLNGQIELKTIPKKGTDFIIYLPQPLSIFRGIVFSILDYNLALPLDWVEKIIDLEELTNFNKNKFFVHQRKKYQIISLFDVLHIPKFDVAYKSMALINYKDRHLALALVRKIEETELIMKQTPLILKNNQHLKGVAVSAKGEVILVLDINNLI